MTEFEFTSGWSNYIDLRTILKAKWSPPLTLSQPDFLSVWTPFTIWIMNLDVSHLKHNFLALKVSHLIPINTQTFLTYWRLDPLSLIFSLVLRLHLSSLPYGSKLDFMLYHFSHSPVNILILTTSLYCYPNNKTKLKQSDDIPNPTLIYIHLLNAAGQKHITM